MKYLIISDPTGKVVHTLTIISENANDIIRHLHDILPNEGLTLTVK